MQLSGSFDTALAGLRGLCLSPAAIEASEELESIARMLALYGFASHLRLDFSLVNDLQYYNGVIFKGYLRALPCELLSGGGTTDWFSDSAEREAPLGLASIWGCWNGWRQKRTNMT